MKEKGKSRRQLEPGSEHLSCRRDLQERTFPYAGDAEVRLGMRAMLQGGLADHNDPS